MILRLWSIPAIVALSACNIEFVGVAEDQRSYAMLRIDQGTDLEASLEVSLPETQEPPLVYVGETQLQAETQGGRWWYRAEPVVDTLEPRVELEIRGDGVVAPLPFVTRNGAATLRHNGDLEIPVVYGGEVSDPHLTWRVELVDSVGRRLVSIDSRSTPLSSPIVLSNELVPATAVAVQVTTRRNEQLSQASYPL
jgi:hypothetical protein